MAKLQNSSYICIMEENGFRFKQFEVSHSRSSMKVGVDAVLLGSWVSCVKPEHVLDVGTGCGVISLMLAQRFSEAKIDAIDIHGDSVEEAKLNFRNSPWSDRLRAYKKEFPADLIKGKEKYDLIISNPPFFSSGIINPFTPREIARHQSRLSASSLLEYSPFILKESGVLAIIIPLEHKDKVLQQSESYGLNLEKECIIKNNPAKQPKRIMIQLVKTPVENPLTENLILFENGVPTPDYRALCREFYLKF